MPGKGQIKAFAPCPDCGESDPKNFSKDKYRGCGVRKVCKACWKLRYYDPDQHKQYKRKHKYGITNDQYDQMFAAQCGLCALCGMPPGVGQYDSLVVDHDHDTNQVRGLIHGRCNSLLGNCLDDTSILIRAVHYLNRFSKRG
jgi:Recombination endonuclease VII